jgi:hypothetical protein
MNRLAPVAGSRQGGLLPVEVGTGFQADGGLKWLQGGPKEELTIYVTDLEDY